MLFRSIEYYQTLGYTTAQWELFLDEYESNTKQWYRLIIPKPNCYNPGIGLVTCQQHKLHWTRFYQGYAEQMRPVYNYNDEKYQANHSVCQAAGYITLYQGRMYKCPPIGVLGHTLGTFDLLDNSDWRPYLDNIVTVGTDSSDQEIADWFVKQAQPEKLCNMCGFTQGPITMEERSHYSKINWNYTIDFR